MDLYDQYKPFRNYMRRFDLMSSLVDIWRYSVHLMEGEPLPRDYAVGIPSPLKSLKEHFYPWDLDVLAKELILNAGNGGDRSLKNWNHLAAAINQIRRIDDAEAAPCKGEARDVFFELHRVAHRQFPWQTNVGVGPIMRVFKIFGEAAVEEIVMRELGMTARQLILLGVAVRGHFLKNTGMSTEKDYAVLGISQESSHAFFKRITCNLSELRKETARRQSYDHDWLYTWNPLEATPLVSFDPKLPERVLCPIPRYLAHRVSNGVFYDLVKSKGFGNPYGSAFQAYVGEVITAVCRAPRFSVLAEEPYYIGPNKKHGVDWVLSDDTGHLFIECKTKRLTLSAKTLSEASALDNDLATMATAVVQHYRNILDALDGRTRWKPNGLPLYPLVLTLEDWFIFSPRVNEMLSEQVRYLLSESQVPEKVLEEMPYTIASAAEFEIASQVISQVGISPVMSKKSDLTRQRWSLLPMLREDFESEMRQVNWRLFANDFVKLMPDVPH
jgi:hypothetical protein